MRDKCRYAAHAVTSATVKFIRTVDRVWVLLLGFLHFTMNSIPNFECQCLKTATWSSCLRVGKKILYKGPYCTRYSGKKVLFFKFSGASTWTQEKTQECLHPTTRSNLCCMLPNIAQMPSNNNSFQTHFVYIDIVNDQ